MAVLILKSAVELVIELIRSRNEDTPNLSKFQFGFSLLVCWSVFFAVYWIATAYLPPRLPLLPLWNSIDFYLVSVGSLPLTLFDLLHLAVGFVLVTHAAFRMSLIVQRHLSIRERRGKKYTKLQTDGFYSRVRHPMAATTLLFNLGLFFAFRTAWALVPFSLVVVSTILSGIIEERKELVKHFGTECEEYKSEVPRRYLTPFLAVYLGITATAYVAGLIL